MRAWQAPCAPDAPHPEPPEHPELPEHNTLCAPDERQDRVRNRILDEFPTILRSWVNG
jgi:hypothetical protein